MGQFDQENDTGDTEDGPAETHDEPDPGEPWAKTSSGEDDEA